MDVPPPTAGTASEKKAFQDRIQGLVNFWGPRNKKFREWYKQLRQTDDLEQKGMESFTTNSPRTNYNLALHLLTPQRVPVKVPNDDLEPNQLAQSGKMESILEDIWDNVDRFNQRRGRARWIRELVGYMLATGWYAIRVGVGDFGHGDAEAIAEVWSPAQTYPSFDDNVGLTEVVHRYTVSRASVSKMARDMNLTLPAGTARSEVQVDDYWYLGDDDGRVYNCIMVDREWLLRPTLVPDLSVIPVLTSPVAGLPDRGSILNDKSWIEHIGEAMVATNSQVLKSYNRQMTFLQQLLRDTAQPISIERNTGKSIVTDPKDLTKRGAHFYAAVNESLEYVAKPPVPVELRTQLFDIDSMLQRGGLPHVMFGNIIQQVTGYLISQVTAAAQQVLSPFGDAVSFIVTEASIMWVEQAEKSRLKPYGKSFPKLPKGTRLKAAFRVNVPGDLAMRATVARMLNPSYSLSQQRLTDMLFPEITDPQEEMAKVRAEAAMNHPLSVQLDLVVAWETEATLREGAGDLESADNFRSAAAALKSSIGAGGGQGAAAGPTPNGQSPRQEVQPRESLEGPGPNIG